MPSRLAHSRLPERIWNTRLCHFGIQVINHTVLLTQELFTAETECS